MVGWDLVLMLGGFLALMAIGVPIPFALLLPSAIYIALDPSLDLFLLANGITNTMLSFPLIAIPLYLLVAEVMSESDAANDLFDLLNAVMRNIRGGLAYANILISLIFAGMSGSYTADLIGLGKLQIPAMVRRGYSKELTVGVTGASACLGPIFPPSIFMILYSMIVGESIGRLFLGGVVPALVMCLFLCLAVYLWPKKSDFPDALHIPATGRLLPLLWKTIPALLTPVIILGTIITGIATATEAAAIALAYSFLVWAIVYRTITAKKILDIFVRTSKFCAAVFIMVGAASVFAWILTLAQLPSQLPVYIQSVTSSPTVALLISSP